MMNRICINVLVIAFIFGLTPWTELAFPQVPEGQSAIKPQKPKPDWVSTMPVSLNGKVSESIRQNWEIHHWHDLFSQGEWVRSNWDAANFFEEPTVVALCEAIFERDVKEMERLIAAGADVNCVGEDGMTPLYWALHMDLDPRPFECLLKHGANPNVIAHLGKRKEHQAVIPGSAVVHLVAQGTYNRQFKNVFENGGDPNLIRSTPLFVASPFWLITPYTPDSLERLQLLIDKGAKLDVRYVNGRTFASSGVVGGVESYCRLVLVVLKAGADYRLYYKEDGCFYRLIHYLADAEAAVNERPASEQTHYRAVVAWLEEQGESFADAKADLQRWEQWKQNGDTDLIEKEHEARLAKEADKSLRTPCEL